MNSRERFLTQLYRCVQHQKDEIPPGPTITAPAELFIPTEFIAPEVQGNGEEVVLERETTYGLTPPGEQPQQIVMGIEDWA